MALAPMSRTATSLGDALSGWSSFTGVTGGSETITIAESWRSRKAPSVPRVDVYANVIRAPEPMNGEVAPHFLLLFRVSSQVCRQKAFRVEEPPR
jgi:hypothetical protein